MSKKALVLLELCKNDGHWISRIDLAVKFYPQHTESIVYEVYKCPSCQGIRNLEVGKFDTGILQKKQCKLPKSNGKKCGALQKKYSFQSTKTIIKFKDYIIKNRCESNLKKKVMDKLVNELKLVEEDASEGILRYKLNTKIKNVFLNRGKNYYRFKKISTMMHQANLQKEYLKTKYFKKNLNKYFHALIAPIVGIDNLRDIRLNRREYAYLKKIISLSPLSFSVLLTEDRPEMIISRGKSYKNKRKKLLEFFLKCFISDTVLRTHKTFHPDLTEKNQEDREIEKIYKKFIHLELKTT